jgi:cytochrome c oxidase subunit 2
MSILDVPKIAQLNFQDDASNQMAGIYDLHQNLMIVLLFIFFFVSFTFARIIINSIYTWNSLNKYQVLRQKRLLLFQQIKHSSIVEIIWTIIPAIILLGIAIPSFALLYSLEDIQYGIMQIKVMGNQWFWSYEIGKANISWSSFLVVDLNEPGMLRLLSVDQPLIIPTELQIRLIVSSVDVIHSFGVPSLGLKVDAVPGRLNQLFLTTFRTGVFYGSCYELCGPGHGFMPIQIISVAPTQFSFPVEN